MNDKDDQDLSGEHDTEEHENGQPGDSDSDIFNDGLFTIKISDEMTLRNALRSGLVEAQGKDTDKIPMFVSWPPWLEDGVVCLFARDLHAVLRKVIRDTAEAVRHDLGVDVPTADLGKSPETFKPPVVSAPEPKKKKEATPPKAPAVDTAPDMPETSQEAEPVPDNGEETKTNGPLSDQDLADKLFTELRNELKK